jgi:hypothetical protein
MNKTMLNKLEKRGLMILLLTINGLMGYIIARIITLHSPFSFASLFSVSVLPGANNVGNVYIPLDIIPAGLLSLLLLILGVSYLILKALLTLMKKTR